jgi:hypothetical protein
MGLVDTTKMIGPSFPVTRAQKWRYSASFRHINTYEIAGVGMGWRLTFDKALREIFSTAKKEKQTG